MPRPSRYGVAGLFKDADGRYRIDLRRAGLPRFQELFPEGTPLAAAKARAQEVLAQAIAGTLRARGQEAPTRLSAALDEYRRLHVTSNPDQQERHCAVLLKAFGDVPLEDVNELAIARFKKARTDEGKAPATVNRELQTLRAFLSLAVEWKWLESRPKVKMLDEPAGRVRSLSDAERERLYPALPKRFKRLVLAANLSGMRLGNVIAIRRADVDFAAKNVHLPKTKSGKSHNVPLTPALEAVIRDAIADGDAQAKRREVEPSEFVFLSRFGKPYTSSGVSGLFRKCAAGAGVKDFHFHDLRHDFATRVRRAGGALDAVQKLLGHATLAMTQRYAHIGEDELHAAARAASTGIGDVALPLPKVPGKARKNPEKK